MTEQIVDMDDVWAQLEVVTDSGTHRRRLDPLLKLSATITNPGALPGLFIRTSESLSFEPSELRGTDQINIEFQITDDGGGSIQLTNLQAAYKEMFYLLVKDLVPRVLEQPSAVGAARLLVRRFNAWQRFLQRASRKGLSSSQQLGLYGELKILETLLLPSVGTAAALESWTGPERQPQDFQIGGMAIEVKSIVHSEPQILKIDGERQLDDFGLDVLLVAHLRVFKHKDSGETLPDLVSALRLQIASDYGAVDDFDELLLTWGYSDVHQDLYQNTGYSLKASSYYRVQPGFPRLIEQDLISGVGGVNYSITADACSRFAVDQSEVVSWFTDPPPVLDPLTTFESSEVEYKQTAWTPVNPVDNQEHRRQIVIEIKKSIVKSVVAFLNSAGGELVVGIVDSTREVTGIEVDLTSMGKSPEDFDFFEQAVMTLLMNHIDRGACAQVRTRFAKHESGTAFHLTVRPSPSPRFGYFPGSANATNQPFFWIRAGNSTQPLEGRDIIDYVQDHWS